MSNKQGKNANFRLFRGEQHMGKKAYLDLQLSHVADESHHLAAAAAVVSRLLTHQLQLLVRRTVELRTKD
jgi:hypothetical protein